MPPSKSEDILEVVPKGGFEYVFKSKKYNYNC